MSAYKLTFWLDEIPTQEVITNNMYYTKYNVMGCITFRSQIKIMIGDKEGPVVLKEIETDPKCECFLITMFVSKIGKFYKTNAVFKFFL